MGAAILLSLFVSFFPLLLLPLSSVMPVASPTFFYMVLKVPFLECSSDYICFLIIKIKKLKKNPQIFFYCLQEKGQILLIVFYSALRIGLEYGRRLIHGC